MPSTRTSSPTAGSDRTPPAVTKIPSEVRSLPSSTGACIQNPGSAPGSTTAVTTPATPTTSSPKYGEAWPAPWMPGIVAWRGGSRSSVSIRTAKAKIWVVSPRAPKLLSPTTTRARRPSGRSGPNAMLSRFCKRSPRVPRSSSSRFTIGRTTGTSCPVRAGTALTSVAPASEVRYRRTEYPRPSTDARSRARKRPSSSASKSERPLVLNPRGESGGAGTGATG